MRLETNNLHLQLDCEREQNNNTIDTMIKMLVVLLENNRVCDAAKQILVLLWGP